MNRLILLAVFVVACQPPPALEKVVRPVRLAAPTTSPCAGSARFTGNVEPAVRVDLAFKRGGYVGEILRVRDGAATRIVDQGDHVTPGAFLAQLRDADYRVKLEQAKAQLAQATAARDQANQDLERAKQLLAGGSMHQAMFDGADARARAMVGQARAAEALVQEAQLALDDCTLRSPLEGVVLKRLVELGSLVGPGSGGFVVADTSAMKVVFGVPDSMLDRLKVGGVLQVLVETLGDQPREGKVLRLSPYADAKSRLFDVEVRLPNDDGRLRAGMVANLRVPEVDAVASSRPVLAIPLRAVVRPPGKTEGFAVFVAEGAGQQVVLRSRVVEPGELCGAQVEIVKGLSAGERVAVDGASLAFDGERVTRVP
jgi:membrane fusion protein, multidrug efflux system